MGERGRLVFGGAVAGFGLGGVLDVLVFHHLLGTHHLLSNYRDPGTLSGLQWNVFWDGAFALAMLAVAVAGSAVAWGTANRSDEPLSPRRLVGSALVGAGLFNLFDGTVDHYVLELHHVVHGTTHWDPHWVLASVLLLAGGAAVLGAGENSR
ncbi:DUF2243 domain-containing protein [Halostella pelagica]|uniref:DUF2243 domain-containing protein n=1 Tax=Halostella pelagica TaxID=2583824 RepID=UPI001080CB9A|nr:DUF2243 domain-containing protein [Halostella pelagica]